MRSNEMTTRRAAGENLVIRRLTATGMMAALITLMTAYIFHIPIGGNGGYVHLGDALIYLSAAILPAPYAMAAGAIGGGLADLLTSPVWAPATVVIKMLIVLPFTSKESKIVTVRNVVALFLAFLISGTGYFLAEGLMFGFKAAFFVSLGSSLIQATGSGVVFLIFGIALDRLSFKTRFFPRV